MQPIQLSIPTACHEDWDKMTPNQQGRFCGSCAKTVIDFSAMTDAQMIAYFENLKNENVCGRVYPDQLNRTLQEAVPMQPRKKMYRLWQYAAALLLFFTKGVQAKAQGEIRGKVVNDTTKKVRTMPDTPIRLGGIRRTDLPENVHVLPAPITQLFITDENNNPLAGASVQLFPQEKLMITDSAGRINLGKNHAITEVKISAIGYEEQEIALKSIKGNSIALKKNMLVLDNVVVHGDNSIRGKVIIAGGISVQRTNNIVEPIPVVSLPQSKEPVFSIYPSPVQKGKEISLTIDAKDSKAYKILVSDAHGKMMLQKNIAVGNKARQQKLLMPALWTSGMYFISVLSENGEVLQSEKIILL
ncbi:MAG: T9SS type A sorting domain-containing protein [Sphingobacteriales bacterium]|nr:MAG: T9SS type A sorting domain-containing protein [Sphingobacteriales bacterium]